MRFITLCAAFLLALPLAQAQSTNPANPSSNASTSGTATGTTSAPPLQDPQAVSILNQATTGAGGAQAISGISDYTATGTITYYPGQQVQGSVTVRGLNTTEIRIDATLPTGVRSWAVHDGILSTKSESGAVFSQTPNRNVPSSDAVAFQTPLFPSSLAFPVQPLNTIVTHQAFGLSNKGTTQIDGHSVYDIQLKGVPTSTVSSKAFTLTLPSRELFIDANSLQIVMVREVLSKNVLNEIHYSNYQTVNGIAMPFSISEDIAGQPIWTIQVSQITFNSSLQNSVFALQ